MTLLINMAYFNLNMKQISLCPTINEVVKSSKWWCEPGTGSEIELVCQYTPQRVYDSCIWWLYNQYSILEYQGYILNLSIFWQSYISTPRFTKALQSTRNSPDSPDISTEIWKCPLKGCGWIQSNVRQKRCIVRQGFTQFHILWQWQNILHSGK